VIKSLIQAWRRATPPESPTPTSGYAEVLAAYAAATTRARESERERRRLRKLVDEIPVGAVFGGWQKRLGETAEIVDLDAVRELLAERGLAVPVKPAAPRLIVEFIGHRGEG
jgi:hypothetical protein